MRGPILAVEDESPQESVMALAEALFHGEAFVSSILPGMAGDLLAVLLLGSFLIARSSLDVVVVGVVVMVSMGSALLAVRGLMFRVSAATERAFQPVFDGVVTAFEGRLDIVASGLDEAFLGETREHLRRWQEVAWRGDLLAAFAGRAPVLAAAAIVGVGVLVDESLRGALQAVALRDAVLVASVVPAAMGLSRNLAEAARAPSRLHSLLDLLDAGDSGRGAAMGASIPPLPAVLEWRNITFSYEGHAGVTTALSGCSLVWKPSEVLLLRGANGSGKSTLFRLLLGLARPQEGSLLVSGVALSSLDLRAWRRSIAYLPQRPYLRETESVRDAVLFHAPGVADEEMLRALQRVDLLPALQRRHPDQPLETRVGVLSAGQRQRLALARLLCRTASIVLLDEPDANLDAEGIEMVTEVVRELARDRMVGIAAHSNGLTAVAGVVVTLATGALARPLSGPLT